MNMFLSMGIHKVKELAISNLAEIYTQLEIYGLFNRLCSAMEVIISLINYNNVKCHLEYVFIICLFFFLDF